VKQAKRDFRTVIIKAGVVDAKQEMNPPTGQKRWWLSVAPLAAPGTSATATPAAARGSTRFQAIGMPRPYRLDR